MKKKAAKKQATLASTEPAYCPWCRRQGDTLCPQMEIYPPTGYRSVTTCVILKRCTKQDYHKGKCTFETIVEVPL